MDINIDYDRPGEMEKELPNPELTVNYIEYAVTEKYKDGLDNQFRRIYARLQRKFDRAIESKQYVVELDKAEIDFIKVAFREVKFPANVAKYVTILEDAIEDLAKEKKPGEDSGS